MPKYEDLPYRPCAGLCVINRKGLVFVGRRADGPEHVDKTHVWQMPQGGIDEGEKPTPRRCVSSTKRPASSRWRSSARSGTG
jgi:putative (di)nucleoside polyphosphate hydrolase